jgi:hypothetical protein
MDSSRDIEEYLQSMLDLTNPDHLKFVEDLLHRLGHSQGTALALKSKSQTATNLSMKGASQQQPQMTKSSKGKVKQINLFSAEGKARENITLPGQHW